MHRTLSFIVALLAFSSGAPAATPQTIITTNPQSEPESVTVAPDGVLILGSASKPFIYRAGKGETDGNRAIWQYAVDRRSRRRQGDRHPDALKGDKRSNL
jgi:hypothetical protein